MDEKSDLELYFRLNETERRIVQTAARMDDTPMACAVFDLYFPGLAAERLRILRLGVVALKD